MSEALHEDPSTEESTEAEVTETTESQEAASPQAGSEQDSEKAPGEQTSEALNYALDIPEGFELNEEGLGSFKKFATEELGLSKENAQKMLNRHLESLQTSMGTHTEQLQAVRQEWAKESMNDKEFGGSALQENLTAAKRTMNSFSNPAVDADGRPVLHTEGTMKGQQMTAVEVLLNETGYGNHPEIIRVFHRAAQVLSQDHYVKGDMKPVEKKKTPAATMYPSMAQ
jgi:hypothetical protein